MAPPKEVLESESVTFSSGKADGSSPPDLRLVHYNDVYHLDPSSAEPKGGVARFMTLCHEYQQHERFRGQPELVTLFSGDAFNPSLESSVTKGAHMVPILNNIGTQAAAVGNHDLDFGVRQFRHLTGKCNFPWLLANVLDPALGEDVAIGNAKRTHMLTASNGIKIGLIGLGEREWLDTINALPPNLIYRSATETARELVPQLRAQGADMVIALTHMREPNDNKLAEQTDGLMDLILGGHDHYYSHSLIKGTHVLRSGTDFKQLSYLEARRADGGAGARWTFDIWRRDLVGAIPEHRPTLELVARLTAKLKTSLDRPVGWTAAPLDARFRTVRLRESNLGNFVCDVMRAHYKADCAIMAAGTIRGDQVYAPGTVRVRDITDCFPFEDPVVVLRVTGRAIWDALENGVSQYPALEGRFPQVSNLKFVFDPSKPTGSRILSVDLGDGPLQMETKYVLATRGYMGRGKDGYDSLLIQEEGGEAEELVSEENGILISMMLRQYFMALRVMNQWTHWSPSMSEHWGGVVAEVNCPLKEAERPTSPQESKAVVREWKRRPSHGWADFSPRRVHVRQASALPLDEDEDGDGDGSDTDEDDGRGDESGEEEVQAVDRELRVMRRVFAKWSRLAGVHAKLCDEMSAEEFTVDWTRAIAPRLEGRIVMIGEGVKA